MGNFVYCESESDGRYWDLFINIVFVCVFKISNFVICFFVYCLFYILLYN